MNLFKVAIVGAAGLVGREFLAILEERKFPIAELVLFGSENSSGEILEFRNKSIQIELLNEENIEKAGVDIAFFSAGALVSQQFSPSFVKSGATVIDNSSAFRMDAAVPLIVPTVNGELLDSFPASGIIANPNCSTIQLMDFLSIVNEIYALTRITVDTYQSVSGAGIKGIDELQKQTLSLLSGSGAGESAVFPQRIAYNVIPHIGAFRPNGQSEEEMKMVLESRKILQLPDLKVDVTTVRVPVFHGHSEAVTCHCEHAVDIDAIKDDIISHPRLKLLDDIDELLYPTTVDVVGKDAIAIGRLRYGNGGEDEHVLQAWVVADNLRTGAALNAIMIAERLVEARG
ncbi:aspartate-semialdehyde dehydrogenase [bacterium]|nr:aspartate-semialdehyde dehydrogenase [bacterium]